MVRNASLKLHSLIPQYACNKTLHCLIIKSNVCYRVPNCMPIFFIMCTLQDLGFSCIQGGKISCVQINNNKNRRKLHSIPLFLQDLLFWLKALYDNMIHNVQLSKFIFLNVRNLGLSYVCNPYL